MLTLNANLLNISSLKYKKKSGSTPVPVNTTIANNTYLTPDHYYDFKGDADDQVGNVDGTVYGATYVENGIIDGSYDFDGSNDYIKFATDLMSYQNKTDFTIMLTINMDATSGWRGILTSQGADSSGHFIMKVTGQQYAWSQFYYGASGQQIASNIPNTGTNYQIVIRGSSTIGHEFWVNGVRGGYDAAKTSDRPVINADVIMGASSGATAWWFDGKMSQLLVADECCSDDFIEWAYNGGSFRQGGYR